MRLGMHTYSRSPVMNRKFEANRKNIDYCCGFISAPPLSTSNTTIAFTTTINFVDLNMKRHDRKGYRRVGQACNLLCDSKYYPRRVYLNTVKYYEQFKILNTVTFRAWLINKSRYSNKAIITTNLCLL